MPYKFTKQNRLLESREFQAVRQGKSFVGKYLVVEAVPSSVGRSRLGLAASKRYGKAHQRNRFKRLVREAFRKLLPELKKTFDVVVRPRKAAHGASSQEIADEMRVLAKMGSKEL